MVPAGMFVQRPAPGRIRLRPRPESYSLYDLAYLEARSDNPDAQRFLRQAIQGGHIRVRPVPGSPSRVRISRVAPDGGDLLPVRRA